MPKTATMTAQLPSAAYETARRAMIDSQLRTSGVNAPWVLAAMAALPREAFVPESARAAAYTDRAVPLGQGRYLAAPLVHGRLLAEAGPTHQDKALLIGEGNGYLAALLRPLVGVLDAVEPAEVAGLRESGYSLLVIDGAIEQLPGPLAASLAEGGRLVTGLVERGVTRLAVGRKVGGAVTLLPLAEIGIPILLQFAAPKRWSF